ncbi:MAG: hypothetical protein Kow0062_01010 [Acidobacteriota bacterium]
MDGVSAVPPAAAGREEALRAARGLEAVLIRQVLAAMERAQLEHGLFGQGPGTGTMATTFELLVSEALAERAPLGLADRIVDQLAGDGSRRRTIEALVREIPAGELEVPARRGANAYETLRHADSSFPAIGRKGRWTPMHGRASPGGGGETK